MIGKGVHNVYKKRASKGGDTLWHVTIKGQTELSPGIRLHLSLKVFENHKDMDIDELKDKVYQFDIQKPKPERLTFKTTIFTSQRDGKKYYMLLIDGVDSSYEKFYESLKHCGTVYKKFMPHITIDKELYDRINEEGLESHEIQFEDLSIEAGTGNTVYEFNKSEDFLAIMRETAFYTQLRESLVVSMPDHVFKNWLDDNKNHQDTIIAKHEDRVRFHFGTSNVARYAIEHGVRKAYEYLRKNNAVNTKRNR